MKPVPWSLMTSRLLPRVAKAAVDAACWSVFRVVPCGCRVEVANSLTVPSWLAVAAKRSPAGANAMLETAPVLTGRGPATWTPVVGFQNWTIPLRVAGRECAIGCECERSGVFASDRLERALRLSCGGVD